MDIFVGNLSYNCDEQTLADAFAEFGQVEAVKILTDRFTGQPKGIAFVTMPDFKEAQVAIRELDGREIDGRPVKVDQARPREDRPPPRGGGGGGGGGGFRGGGGGGGRGGPRGGGGGGFRGGGGGGRDRY